MFCKNGFLKNFIKITGKYLGWRLFKNIFLLKTSGGYFFQMFLNLKKRKEHTQFKNTVKYSNIGN